LLVEDDVDDKDNDKDNDDCCYLMKSGCSWLID
jgi:hypothetical protein